MLSSHIWLMATLLAGSTDENVTIIMASSIDTTDPEDILATKKEQNLRHFFCYHNSGQKMRHSGVRKTPGLSNKKGSSFISHITSIRIF